MLNVHTIDDPEDLIMAYQKTPSLFFEIASRLLQLKKYGYFIILWNKEMTNITRSNEDRDNKDNNTVVNNTADNNTADNNTAFNSNTVANNTSNSNIQYNNISNNNNISNDMMMSNSKKLIQSLSMITRYSKELCEAGEADTLIRSLLSLLDGDTFESYKVCCTISDLVQNKRQFPSKATAILYFQRISAMLKTSNNILSYLNALHLLNELEPFSMSRKEFELLKKFSAMKSETICKELFCGVKLRSLDSIVVGLDDSDFTVTDPNLDAILKFNIGDKIDLKYVFLLAKYTINFKIESGMIEILPPSNERFTSVIFNIANRFIDNTNNSKIDINSSKADNVKSATDNINNSKADINNSNTNLTSKIDINSGKSDITSKTTNKNNTNDGKKQVFKNRFTAPYKKSKLIKLYCKLEFQDVHFEERNSRRELRITELMNKKEEDRSRLLKYKSVVEDLLEQLNLKIEERNEKERLEMLEKAKLEEERALKERMSQMWRGSVEIEKNQSAVDVSQNEGIYVSKFNTMNFTESNILLNSSDNSNKNDISNKNDLSNKNEGIYVPKFSTIDFMKNNMGKTSFNKK